jgi:hypothetical protein
VAKTFVQFVAAAIGPLLTLGATLAVQQYVARSDAASALGAAIASAFLFVLALAVDALPKKSAWWRTRFDKRAAFEGVWVQLHDSDPRRLAVFSFVYMDDSDEYEVRGDAFDPLGARLAQWTSTRVFFSTGSKQVSYLWEGIAREGDRQGTTTMSLDPAAGSVRPLTGTGTVLHLMEARRLDFRLRRITQDDIARLGVSSSVADLQVNFDRRKELAIAWLRANPGAQSAS